MNVIACARDRINFLRSRIQDLLRRNDPRAKQEIATLKAEIARLHQTIEEDKQKHDDLQAAHKIEMAAKDETIAANGKTIAAKDETIAANEKTIAAKDETIAAKDETIAAIKETISASSAAYQDTIKTLREAFTAQQERLAATHQDNIAAMAAAHQSVLSVVMASHKESITHQRGQRELINMLTTLLMNNVSGKRQMPAQGESSAATNPRTETSPAAYQQYCGEVLTQTTGCSASPATQVDDTDDEGVQEVETWNPEENATKRAKPAADDTNGATGATHTLVPIDPGPIDPSEDPTASQKTLTFLQWILGGL